VRQRLKSKIELETKEVIGRVFFPLVRAPLL
jgi:hypothetical protein